MRGPLPPRCPVCPGKATPQRGPMSAGAGRARRRRARNLLLKALLSGAIIAAASEVARRLDAGRTLRGIGGYADHIAELRARRAHPWAARRVVLAVMSEGVVLLDGQIRHRPILRLRASHVFAGCLQVPRRGLLLRRLTQRDTSASATSGMRTCVRGKAPP
jgi:hypothetical protein